MRPELERRPGTRQFHGGPIAAFIDITGDFAIGMLVGGGVPTMNFRTDYLRPAIGEALTAVARVRRAGKTAAIVDIEVVDDGKETRRARSWNIFEQRRLRRVGSGTSGRSGWIIWFSECRTSLTELT